MIDEKSNTGDSNTGDWNTGNLNTGDSNTGNLNTGDSNTGHRNTGDSNTGNYNTGDSNTGHYNTGDSNTGNYNTGDSNTGDYNTGHYNTGDWNTGHYNTGDWNTGNLNTGYFNTNSPKIRMFNKDTEFIFGQDIITIPSYMYFNTIEYKDLDEMTLEEKEKYKTIGWCLRVLDYKEAFKKSFNEKCDKIQAEQTINLPNFDYKIFEEISGITKEMLDKKRGINKEENHPKEITFNNAKYKLVEE